VGLAAASVMRRPAGTRHAGQPNRWGAQLGKQETVSGDPSDSSIRRALETKSAAAMVVAANGASARLKAGACFPKTADPELAALVRHASWCGRPGGSRERETVERWSRGGLGDTREKTSRAFRRTSYIHFRERGY